MGVSRDRKGRARLAARFIENAPLLADTAEVSVETVGHDGVHADHINPGLEAAGGEVTLYHGCNR